MTYCIGTRCAWAKTAGLLATVAWFATAAQAGDYYTTVPILPTVNIGPDGEGATKAEEVYGKEYSHTNPSSVNDPRLTNVEDHDAFGAPDPLQVVSWDGQPGPIGGNSGSVDSFDYGNSPGFNYPEGQVDALANRGDFLFRQVVRNEASLLFSVTSDIGAPGGVGPGAHVHWEAPVGPGAGFGTGHGVWAAIEAPPVDGGAGPGVNHHKVWDLDALEVWGPEPPGHDNGDSEVREGYVGGGPGVGFQTGDANRFSLDMDSASGISVWAYNINTAAITPWVLHTDIVAAVEELFLTPMFGPGSTFGDETRRMIDVDATMARDLNGDLDGTSMAFGPGDELLFSIDPIDTAEVVGPDGNTTTVTGLIDGGEIMHLVKTAAGIGPGTFGISFLNHGGHLWDTKFDVAGTFGYEFEDIDGLEAVGTLTGDTSIPTPEPSTMLLCGLAMVAAGGYRLRRSR